MDRRRSRVLLVEDDAAVRRVVRRQLESLGWEVLPAGTGREAIEMIDRDVEIDVLLTDVDLPDVRGTAVAREMRHASPRTRIVFMSGAPRTQLEPRDAPLLVKPFSRETLAKAMAVIGQPR